MANIFQQYLAPPKSVLDYSAELDQADARKQAFQQNALALAAGQQKFDEGQQAGQRSAQLRAALMGLPQGATDDQRIQAMRGTATPEGFAAADALSKSLLDQRKGAASASKDEADAAQTNLKRDISLHDFHAQKLAMVQTPEDAMEWAKEGNALGLFKQPGQFMRGVAAIQQAAQSPEAFAKWKAGAMQAGQSIADQMKQQLEQAKQAEQVRQFGVTDQRIKAEGDASRANQIKVQQMIGDRQDARDVSVSHGVKGLTPEQNEALFGENGAVTTGRLDPNRVNSKTASIFADAELKRAGTDFSKISGDIALGRNATFRQNAMTAEVLPEVMQNMVNAGKKIGFSDNRTIGKMQGWVKGEFNDPDMTEYMTQRNDALMTVARVMRGAGMTDMAHKAETEVSSPTMSPAALDAWMRGQMKSLQPRLDINRRITRDTPKDRAPATTDHPVDISDLLKKYGGK